MSNVIVLDSSDEEDSPPAKKLKKINSPIKQNIQQLQEQPFKKMQNSIQITPIYNNNNNNNNNTSNNNLNNINSPKVSQVLNKSFKSHLDKINTTTIGGITINKASPTIINSPSPLTKTQTNSNNFNNNNSNVNNRPINLTISEVKTLNVNNLLNNSTIIPINLPNSVKNSITVKRINSPVSQTNNLIKSISPIATSTSGLIIKSINVPKQQILSQQQKRELLDQVSNSTTKQQILSQQQKELLDHIIIGPKQQKKELLDQVSNSTTKQQILVQQQKQPIKKQQQQQHNDSNNAIKLKPQVHKQKKELIDPLNIKSQIQQQKKEFISPLKLKQQIQQHRKEIIDPLKILQQKKDLCDPLKLKSQIQQKQKPIDPLQPQIQQQKKILIDPSKVKAQIVQQQKDFINPLKLPEISQLQKMTFNNNHILLANNLPFKRNSLEKTNFEKNLEQQIAQRQQKPPTQSITMPPQRKRIKPITIASKIDCQNWINNNHSPIITIDDDDDDNISNPKSARISPKPFSVNKLNNSYIQNISSPIETNSVKELLLSPNKILTSRSIPHTITSPVEISTNNKSDKKTEQINKNEEVVTKPVPILSTSSASTTPNSKNHDNDNNDKNPIIPPYEELLKVCREADPSIDMEKLIDTKLLKYYHSVHPDFVISKNFRKIIDSTIDEIKNSPKLVYLKLKTIVEELKTRRKSKHVIVNNEEEHTTTGDSRKDDLVKKLNRGLYKLQMIINKLEEDDVDFDNDSNSPYLKVERYKKRACEIYEKICDLTGESKHAHRLVTKPISFHGTAYPSFNKAIQTFVNRTKLFPDYLDIYRLLEFCNKQNSWDMLPEEMKIIAQEAFIKIGKLLQKRRQTDLYETVMHFTGNNIDPAENDTTLNAKLLENQKHVKKISTVLEKYSKKQDFETEERHNAKDDKNNENSKESEDEISCDESDNENDNNKIEKNLLKLDVLKESTSISTITTSTYTTAAPTIPTISLTDNNNTVSDINSLQNPQPSTSHAFSDIKICSVKSLSNNNNNNVFNIVGEIILSDDDDET